MSYLGNKPAEVPLTSADLADSIVTSANIADDTIVNVDVNNISATKITAGTVATARLGSGTASSSTVLYGDQTYKAEPTGVSLTGSTNNTIPTVTGANALTGEANLTFNAATDPPVLLLEASRLEIKHTGDFGLYSTFNTNRGAAGDSLGELLWQWNGTAVAKIQARAGVDTTNKDDGSMAFYTTTSGGSITERMRITSEGVVGMGAVLDGDLGVGLHIKTSDTGADVHSSADELVIERNGDGGMTFLNSTSGESFINFGDSGDNDIGQMSYHHSSNHMAFKTNASERVRINSSGDVGIGTDNPVDKLHVVESASTAMAKFDCTNTGNGATLFKIKCHNTTAGDYAFFVCDKAGYSQMYVHGDGDLENVNNSYGAISDERIKKDITDANSQWDDIKALKVKNYKLKADDTESTQLGVIAQDLETAGMNGLVKESKPDEGNARIHSDFGTIEDGTEDNGATPIKDDDGNITGYEHVFTEGEKVKAVKYSVLYMKAIKCLQEAITKIETLETSNTDLTTRLEALENA